MPGVLFTIAAFKSVAFIPPVVHVHRVILVKGGMAAAPIVEC
jgi:hypothetical protein